MGFHPKVDPLECGPILIKTNFGHRIGGLGPTYSSGQLVFLTYLNKQKKKTKLEAFLFIYKTI